MLIIAALFGLAGAVFLYGGVTDYHNAKYVTHQSIALSQLLIAAILLGVAAIIVSLEKRTGEKPPKPPSQTEGNGWIAGVIIVTILGAGLGFATARKEQTPLSASLYEPPRTTESRWTPSTIVTGSTKAATPSKTAVCTAYVNGNRIGAYHDREVCARNAKLKGLTVVYH